MSEEKTVVAVIGSTGLPGYQITIAILKKQYRGVTVRALVRPNSPKKTEISNLQSLGAEIIEADILNEEALEKALQGSDKVIDATMNTTNSRIKIPLIAKRAGAKHLIWNFGSKFWLPPQGVMPVLDDKKEVLKAQKEAGITQTLINTGLFVDYLSYGYINKETNIITTVPNCPKMQITCADDVAAYTANIVLDKRAENASCDIYTANVTMEELATIVEKATGTNYKLVSQTKDELQKIIENDKTPKKGNSIQIQALYLLATNPDFVLVNPQDDVTKWYPDVVQADLVDFFRKTLK